MTREAYLTTILDTVAHFKSKSDKISVYLILAIDRGTTTATEALEIIDLAIANKARGVVGVDLCGNPTQGDVTIYRDAFSRAKAHGLGVTLHFAETPASGDLRELNALLSFQPDRLGHVIHVPGDVKREIARRRLGLELCMSCNVHAKLIEGGFLDHHFGEWRGQDCPIALCVSKIVVELYHFPSWLFILTFLAPFRRMTWASFAVQSQMSTFLLRSTLVLTVQKC